MELSEKLTKDIQEYCDKYQPKMDWDRDTLDNSTLKDILEKGFNAYIDELWETNIEYIIELAEYGINDVYETFEDELTDV